MSKLILWCDWLSPFSVYLWKGMVSARHHHSWNLQLKKFYYIGWVYFIDHFFWSTENSFQFIFLVGALCLRQDDHLMATRGSAGNQNTTVNLPAIQDNWHQLNHENNWKIFSYWPQKLTCFPKRNGLKTKVLTFWHILNCCSTFSQIFSNFFGRVLTRLPKTFAVFWHLNVRPNEVLGLMLSSIA